MCVWVVCETSCKYVCMCVYAGGASIMGKTTIDFDSILSPFLSRLLQVTWRDAQVAEQHCSKVPTSTKSGVERESNFSIFSSKISGEREKSRVQSLPKASHLTLVCCCLCCSCFLVNIWCEQQKQHNMLCCFSLSFLSLSFKLFFTVCSFLMYSRFWLGFGLVRRSKRDDDGVGIHWISH